MTLHRLRGIYSDLAQNLRPPLINVYKVFAQPFLNYLVGKSTANRRYDLTCRAHSVSVNHHNHADTAVADIVGMSFRFAANS